MEMFNVYPKIDLEPVKGEGCWLSDPSGIRYLDLYGGHAVISVGHSHPYFVGKITEQTNALAFYSNAVEIPIQRELAAKLGEMCGYPDYSLFLCNSGAEAVENALKLASFHSSRSKILAFRKGFHGRTSGALAVTDNNTISAPVNFRDHVFYADLNDAGSVSSILEQHEIAAVIIEGIQGIGGVHVPGPGFLQQVEESCKKNGTMLILDEIQSGYGRTGKFFAHQYADITPDLITVAKGMGNGFPIGGVLINPRIKAHQGMLGSTFGGNHLACAAGIAVLEIMETENLLKNALIMGTHLRDSLSGIEAICEIRGSGLMIGLEFKFPVKGIKRSLLNSYRVLTGSSSDPNVLRLLPPLTIGTHELKLFVKSLKSVLSNESINEKVHLG